MRLAKYLAHAGVSARRQAEEIILRGEVKVNGQIVKELGVKIDPDVDKIEYQGRVLSIEKNLYILFYKPGGFLSTVDDPFKRKTIMEFFPEIKARIYPVGRLDYDTSGLLILTNDGEFTNLMIHPRYKIPKTYQTLVKGVPTVKALEALRRGVILEDGKTAPAQVSIIKEDRGKALLEITIHEGKKRQIKRMCEFIGHPVIALKRTAFAFLNLKGLKPGEYRFLTKQEIKRLINLTRK